MGDVVKPGKLTKENMSGLLEDLLRWRLFFLIKAYNTFPLSINFYRLMGLKSFIDIQL